MWHVVIPHSVIKVLKKIPKRELLLISECLYELESWPDRSLLRDINKLTNVDDGYRIRVGVYRIIFIVEKKEIRITIIKVTHRKDAYKK